MSGALPLLTRALWSKSYCTETRLRCDNCVHCLNARLDEERDGLLRLIGAHKDAAMAKLEEAQTFEDREDEDGVVAARIHYADGERDALKLALVLIREVCG